MSILLEAEKQIADTQSAWADEYRALINRHDVPKKSDGARLGVLMEALGLSREDVQSDMDAVTTLAETSDRLRKADEQDIHLLQERMDRHDHASREAGNAVAEMLASMPADQAIAIAYRAVVPLNGLVPAAIPAIRRLDVVRDAVGRSDFAISAARQQRARDTNTVHALAQSNPRVVTLND